MPDESLAGDPDTLWAFRTRRPRRLQAQLRGGLSRVGLTVVCAAAWLRRAVLPGSGGPACDENMPRVLAFLNPGPCLEDLKDICDSQHWILKLGDAGELSTLPPQTPYGVVLYQREYSGRNWSTDVLRLASGPSHPWVVLLSPTRDKNLWDELVRYRGADLLRVPLQPDQVIHTVRTGWSLWRSRRRLAGRLNSPDRR